MILYMLQGIPGSGKSVMANVLKETFGEDNCQVFSTDDFWYENGKYNFLPTMLGFAHIWNQKRVLNAMKDQITYIVVDNTNIKLEHAKPYFDLAANHGYGVQVISVQVPLELAIARQDTR